MAKVALHDFLLYIYIYQLSGFFFGLFPVYIFCVMVFLTFKSSLLDCAQTWSVSERRE